METQTLKLSCALTGYSFNVLKNYDGPSKRKVGTMAISMMLPTCIWFLNGYFLVTNMFKGPVFLGVVVGLILAAFIFFIERTIILSAGGSRMAILRLILGICSALIGSIVLKSVIFEKDIENRLLELRMAKAGPLRAQLALPYQMDIADVTQNITYYEAEYKDYAQKAKDESTGKYTDQVGAGNLTHFYGQQRDSYIPLIKEQKAVLAGINGRIDGELASQLAEMKDDEGLWTKIDAFFDVAFKNARGVVLFFIFFITLMIVEIIVITTKYSPKSNYEFEEETVAKALREGPVQF